MYGFTETGTHYSLIPRTHEEALIIMPILQTHGTGVAHEKSERQVSWNPVHLSSKSMSFEPPQPHLPLTILSQKGLLSVAHTDKPKWPPQSVRGLTLKTTIEVPSYPHFCVLGVKFWSCLNKLLCHVVAKAPQCVHQLPTLP